ncbi:MAG: VCBS repeat-containing protein, partial [Chlorobi bacterium]|nr:VCBS repeat-containing protein [Chlorobiota bacterium]
MKKTTLNLFLLVAVSVLQAQNFQTEHIVSFGNIYSPSVMIPVDLDNDGDMDIIMNGPGNRISWVENFGAGEFGFQQDIKLDIQGITDVSVIDIDNDGYQDVLLASQSENSIYWCKNDGSGNFYQANTISDSVFSAQLVYAIDIDGDGNNDVVSGGWMGSKLAWYKNDGNGNFGFQNLIDDDLGKVGSVYAKDLDNDGDNDIIAIAREESLLAWYENINGGVFFEKHIITTSIDDGRSVYSDDIDSDGDNDILSASFWDGKIAWYENDGNGSFGQQNIISENTGHAERVFASDLDNDGDLDVLSAFYSDQKVAWNENLGNGIFGEQITISEIGGRKTVTAYDIDNDGDEDVLSNGYWFKNDGVGNFGEAIFPITVVGLPYDVLAFDVNNDQVKEIFYSSGHSGWIEHKNSGNYVITALSNPDSLTHSTKVAITDIDNDGNPDVFFGYHGALARYHIVPDGTIIYDGIIDTVCWEVESLEFADFDNDGDEDILVSTSYFDGFWTTERETEIKWIENINNGNEWIPHQLYSHVSFGCYYRSKPLDIDNDGDIDILSRNCHGDSLYFF